MKKISIKFAPLFSIFLISFCAATVSPQTVAAISESPEELSEKVLQMEIDAKKFSLQWNRESINRAISLYSEAVKYRRELKQFDKVAACLRKIGQLKTILVEKEEAVDFFKQALEVSNQYEVIDEKIKSLSLLSLWASDAGKIPESREYFEAALKLARENKNALTRAAALFSAGEFYLYDKNPTEAIKYYEQSLESWNGTGDPEGEAHTFLELGYAYIERENFGEGIKNLEKSLSKWQEADNLRGQALTYIAFGLAFLLTNEKQKALDSYKKAEQIFPQDLDYFDKAILYNGIGAIYEEYGEWEISIKYRKDALELYKKSNHIYGQLATLPSLASLSNFIGNKEDALDYMQQGQELAVKFKTPFYRATIEKELGFFYLESGSFEKALENFQLSLSYFKKSDFKRDIALINNKIGELHAKQNDPKSARYYFNSALEVHRKVQNKFGEAQTLFNLAKLDAAENNKERALSLSRESLLLTESLFTDILNSKLKSTYFSNVFDRYELYINLLMKRHQQTPEPGYAIQALQAAEKSKARSMLENLSLSEANFTKDADAQTVGREKEIRFLLNNKADKLTDLLSSSNADKSEIDKISREINELQNELEEIKARLKQSSPIYSAIKNPAPFDVGEFQDKILNENSVLLEFSLGAEESYLWLVGKNEIDSYVLAPRAEIESHVENLRALLGAHETKPGEAVEISQRRIKEAAAAYEREAQLLSEKLFGQVAGKLSGKRLIIVPDGKLHYFPVGALTLPNAGDNAPILLTNETVYEPSAQTLALLKKSRNAAPAGKNFLVFSDPVFSVGDARLIAQDKPAEEAQVEPASLGRLRFAESLNSLPRLTASKAEADSIIDIIGTRKADNLTGFSASRERLLNANVSDYKIIHFATHGLINEQRPELSGIVLSRFDERGRQIDESVRLHDIYGLNLNADLVVLSACSTGVGKEVKGEGLLSLNNAFLQVGAKSVVSSLWKVDDDATKELMKNFYQGLTSENLTTSEALRRAQIKLSQEPQYKSPFYWAAFTLQGDFENVPRLSAGFGYWIYFLLIIPLLAFGVYLFGKSGLFNRKIVGHK